jgi:hypothetical protein
MFLVWVSADVLVAVFTPKGACLLFALVAFYCGRRRSLNLMQRHQQSLLVVIVIHTPILAPSGAALNQRRRGSIIFIRIRFLRLACCWRADEQQARE